MIFQSKLKQKACQLPGLNRGPSDLQSDALPTELSWHKIVYNPIILLKSFINSNY